VISSLTTGHGPPVIVVPGALLVAADYAAFAEALGQTHTVHTIERRGRSPSGPQGEDYGMVKECEDLAAVQEATGSELVFGHSYGGLIALEAARTSTAFRKVAIYEPGVSVAGSIDLGWTPAYERKLAEGKPLDAFALFSIGAGPRPARTAPVWLMKRLLPLLIGRADLRRMLDLLAVNLSEHQVVGQFDNSYPAYQTVRAEVLAMHGGRSGLDWVARAMNALALVIPSIDVQEFPKLDHFGPTKTGPSEVASVVRSFFLRQSEVSSDPAEVVQP
jgi:pimeloyl-ACP methyl ester carboxylesterase